MKRALFIGRFQPFHDGHLGAVLDILKQFDQVIIAIGSPQESYSSRNPFTCSERFEMIHRTMASTELLDRTIITIAPDIKSNAVWANYIKTILPEFDVVFTNNQLVYALFAVAGIRVEGMIIEDQRHITGTFIRENITSQKHEWEHMVPWAVMTYIKEHELVERFRWIR